MPRVVGEEVCLIDGTEQPGVDVVRDILETDTLERAGVATARVVILASKKDSTTLLAAAVVRYFAPDFPILACADQVDKVERIQKVGADFALSVSQVAGQFLMHHLIGDVVSQQEHRSRSYAVLSFGSFLGMGEKLFAVPWKALKLDTEHKRFVLDVEKDRLKSAPGFDRDKWPDMADPSWISSIHDYYGTEPQPRAFRA